MSQQNVLLLLLVQLLELRRLQHFGVDLHDPLGKGCHAGAGAAGVADDGGVDDFLFTTQNNSATATLRTRTTAKNKENKDQFHISKKKEDENELLIFFSMSRSRRRQF